MILFGKRPASYASDSSNHKPVGLFNCTGCGATVTEPNKAVHEEWHASIEKRIKEMEDRPQVVINNTPGVTPPYTQPSYPNTWPNYPYTPIIWSTTGNTMGTYNTSFAVEPPKDDDNE